MINIKKSLTKSNTQKFHEKTKIYKFSSKLKDSTKWPREWTTQHFKSYPRFENHSLPTKIELPEMSISNALLKRKSNRNLEAKKLSLSKLSTLLYLSGGILPNSGKNLNETRRFYPSAGARYPLEIYPILISLSGMKQGVYHYNVVKHSLEHLWPIENLDKKITAITGDAWISRSSCILILTAVLPRNQIKYGDRGYRHILIETGHLSQNIYLVATSLGMKVCSIGGFMDDEVSKILDIGKDEIPIAFIVISA